MTNGVEYVYEQMKELQVNKYELKYLINDKMNLRKL